MSAEAGDPILLNGEEFACEDCNNNRFHLYSVEPERVACTKCGMIYWLYREQEQPQ